MAVAPPKLKRAPWTDGLLCIVDSPMCLWIPAGLKDELIAQINELDVKVAYAGNTSNYWFGLVSRDFRFVALES